VSQQAAPISSVYNIKINLNKINTLQSRQALTCDHSNEHSVSKECKEFLNFFFYAGGIWWMRLVIHTLSGRKVGLPSLRNNSVQDFRIECPQTEIWLQASYSATVQMLADCGLEELSPVSQLVWPIICVHDYSVTEPAIYRMNEYRTFFLQVICGCSVELTSIRVTTELNALLPRLLCIFNASCQGIG